jgi:hypothetical protein
MRGCTPKLHDAGIHTTPLLLNRLGLPLNQYPTTFRLFPDNPKMRWRMMILLRGISRLYQSYRGEK